MQQQVEARVRSGPFGLLRGAWGSAERLAGSCRPSGAPPRLELLIQAQGEDLRLLLWSKCLMWESWER